MPALAGTARTAVVLTLTAGSLTVACAGARTGDTTRPNRNLITLEELSEAEDDGVRDLYELIERLRPQWLIVRAARSLQVPTVIAVYHHETLLGGINVLRGHPLMNVTAIRYLDASQAMLLPGAGSAHVEGAIVISTTIPRQPDPPARQPIHR